MTCHADSDLMFVALYRHAVGRPLPQTHEPTRRPITAPAIKPAPVG